MVVLREDAEGVSEDDIVRYVNSRVDADYKKIRGRVLFRKVRFVYFLQVCLLLHDYLCLLLHVCLCLQI